MSEERSDIRGGVALAEPIQWPNSLELPLYMSVADAAKVSGVSYETMRSWADAAVDPIPHIRVGKAKKLIRTAAIPDYLKGKEAR